MRLPRWARRPSPWASSELPSLGVIVVLAFLVGDRAHQAWVDRALTIDGAVLPSLVEAGARARRASFLFGTGVFVLAAARLWGLMRRRDPMSVPLLVPAAAGTCLLGLAVHHATVETARRTVDGARRLVVLLPTDAPFAEGFAIGAVVAALLLVVPAEPSTIVRRLRVPIALTIVGTFVALAIAGSGPPGSGTRINLGPVQPIEAVKLLCVSFLATYLGARASKLRWQRERWLGLRWPRPALLVPSLAVLVGIFAGLYVVGDLGPVTILALVFLGMFYLVTRATGWAALAIGLVSTIVAVVATKPELLGVGRVVTRVRMWREPFRNGIAYGDQLGEALWSIAAGGPFGQGLAQANTPLVVAGKTDLVLATLAEQLGAAGLLTYVSLLGVVVLSGMYVASRARTADRVLLAGGASLLLVLQWFIIHGGTFGALPLTGVVVPFLSSGRTSMVAFMALVGLLARLADEGAMVEPTPALEELHGAARSLGGAVIVLLLAGTSGPIRVGVLERHAISAESIATRLGDGSLVHRSNPRLLAMARSIRRGAILDRNGEPLAVTDPGGRTPRRYPLGSAMGTLLGSHPTRVLLPRWALERVFEQRLRGHGQRDDGLEGRRHTDLRGFAPLLDLPRDVREAHLRSMDEAVDARSVRLSIDARLQRRVASILDAAMRSRGHVAAAAVVIEVDSGRILARAQVPDLDPGAAWQDVFTGGDEDLLARFTGAYGPWPDKTGGAGYFQAGSIGKLFTALAAVRSGFDVHGSGCAARGGSVFACTKRDEDGPYFTLPSWQRPIHDHFHDGLHGQVDLVEAIAVSCNVYFGQLALELGPEPLVELWEAGVDVGYGRGRRFAPGAAGTRQLASTGFGQGAMVMNVLDAARLTAAIGAGGRHRVCPSTMELAAPCSETVLVEDPRTLAPVLAGMRRVLTHGTGRSLREPEGQRIYGKTGTADANGFAGEESYGFEPGATAPPHSWFVALVERSGVPECSSEARGRLAIAVVVPRGGAGASAAGPIAMEIAQAAGELGYLTENGP